MTDPLVTTAEVAARLDDPRLRLLDASWHMPDSGRDGAAEFAVRHLPGARFFDLEAVSASGELPHTLPTADAFAASLGDLGISDGDSIVVYDAAGLFSAPRAWWMLRAMGHDNVAVMDGGLPKWLDEGRPVTDEIGTVTPATPGAIRNDALVADGDDVAAASLNGTAQIVDARSAGRFSGALPEPRPGLRAGHIPGSINLPYGGVLNPDGTMKDAHALRAAFADAGVDVDRPVVTTCGSGVTAAILSLALARLGHSDHALYDGSWADWGREGGRPVGTLS